MARSVVHPGRALAYATAGNQARSTKGGNLIAAILWLYLGIVGLVVIRRGGQLPTQGQFVTLAGGAGAVVLAGSFAPKMVLWFLVALLIAAALTTPNLSTFLTSVDARVAALNKPEG